MPTFKCGFCDEEHDELPMDLAFIRPPDFFDVPPLERVERVTLTSDLCTIDDKYYIRGVLRLPVKGAKREFSWGVWAEVRERDYRRHVDLWDAYIPPHFPPFRGKLCGEIPCYPNSHGLKLSIRLQPDGRRPNFRVVSKKHPLGVDQRRGITMEQVHVFVAPMLNKSRQGTGLKPSAKRMNPFGLKE